MFIIWYRKIKIKVNHIVAGVYLFTQAYIFTYVDVDVDVDLVTTAGVFKYDPHSL